MRVAFATLALVFACILRETNATELGTSASAEAELAFRWKGRTTGFCQSTGDTHVVDFANKYCDAMGEGTYLYTKSPDGFVEVQGRQRRWLQDCEYITVLKDMGIKCGKDILTFETSGGPPHDTAPVVVNMKLNGKPIAVEKGTDKWIRKFEKGQHHPGLAGAFHLSVKSWGSRVYHWEAKCNERESFEEPGTVTLTGMSYKINVRRARTCDKSHMGRPRITKTFNAPTVYSNLQLGVDDRTLKPGTLSGLCGWRTEDEEAAMSANLCCQKREMSEQCRNIVIAKPNAVFFDNDKIHEEAMRENPEMMDATKLALLRAGCAKKVQAVLTDEWAAVLPKDIASRFSKIERECAFDEYFGVEYSEEEVKEDICALVQEEVSALRGGIAENFQSLRCVFDYNHALASRGDVSFRVATEEYFERIDKLRLELANLAAGGCKFADGEQEESAFDVPCHQLPDAWLKEIKVKVGLSKSFEVPKEVSVVPNDPPADVSAAAPTMPALLDVTHASLRTTNQRTLRP